MAEFTIKRGNDGFGSQMLAILIGYLIGCETDNEYLYSSIDNIKLVNVGFQNQELDQINNVLSIMMSRLGVRKALTNTQNLFVPHTKLPHLCTNLTLQGRGIASLKTCWPLLPTSNKQVLSIHIRMGDDIEADNRARCQPIYYYNDLIKRCLKTFPNHIIQLISWREPDIIKDLKSFVTIKSSQEGGEILEHYNEMVHSDILIIGSSSFSMSAGLLNKGTVLCDKNIIGISPPYPKEWNDNFEELLG